MLNKIHKISSETFFPLPSHLREKSVYKKLMGKVSLFLLACLHLNVTGTMKLHNLQYYGP